MKFALLASTAVVSLAASGAACAVDLVTKVQDLGTITVPAVIDYGHNFQSEPAPGLQPTDRFYDEYGFHIDAADFSSFTATLDFGSLFQVSNLSARLVAADIKTVTTGPVTSQPVLVAWSTVSSGAGPQQVIAPITLAAGDYILEVRGNVTGSFGGAYVGVMNFGSPGSVTPVPEPATTATLIAGLAVLGMRRGRRGQA